MSVAFMLRLRVFFLLWGQVCLIALVLSLLVRLFPAPP